MKALIQQAAILMSFALIGSAIAQDWQWRNPLPQGNALNDVKFINETTGWAVGSCGTIIHTTDGGQTWACQESGVTSDLSALWFWNEQFGFIAGGESG